MSTHQLTRFHIIHNWRGFAVQHMLLVHRGTLRPSATQCPPITDRIRSLSLTQFPP